jgi:hypothetical protein
MAIDEVGERAFATGCALHELSPQAGSLEELFLTWTTPAHEAQSDQEVNAS